MKKIIPIILMLFVTGCSSAFRDLDYVPSNGIDWQIEKHAASYNFENYEYRVGGIGMERLFVIGPVIPIIPFKHKYPGYFTVSIAGKNEGANLSCPVLNIMGKSFNGSERHISEECLSCSYELGRKFICKCSRGIVAVV